MAVLLLYVFAFSNVFMHNDSFAKVSHPDSKKLENSKKAGKKSDKSDKFYFSKASIEAVISSISPSFDCESVIFQIPEFSFTPKERLVKVIQSFANQYHLEILFEHLIAPNAP